MTEADWSHLKRSNRLLWWVVALQGLVLASAVGWLCTRRHLSVDKLHAGTIDARSLNVSHIELVRPDGQRVGSLRAGSVQDGPTLEMATRRQEVYMDVRLGLAFQGPRLTMTRIGPPAPSGTASRCQLSIDAPHPRFEMAESSSSHDFPHQSYSFGWASGADEKGETFRYWHRDEPGVVPWRYPSWPEKLRKRLESLTPSTPLADQQDLMRQMAEGGILDAEAPAIFRLCERHPTAFAFPKGFVDGVLYAGGYEKELLASLARTPTCTTVQLLGKSIEKGMDTVGETSLRELLAKLAEDGDLPAAVRKCAQSQLESVRQRDQRLAEWQNGKKR